MSDEQRLGLYGLICFNVGWWGMFVMWYFGVIGR